MLFSEIGQIARAFKGISRPNDPEVASSLDILVGLKDQGEAIGFFGRDRGPSAAAVAIRILQENGKNLTIEQSLLVADQLNKIDAARAVRSRFYVQVIVTMIILGVGVGLALGIIQGTEPLQRLGYGFIGTVLGYWLR